MRWTPERGWLSLLTRSSLGLGSVVMLGLSIMGATGANLTGLEGQDTQVVEVPAEQKEDLVDLIDRVERGEATTGPQGTARLGPAPTIPPPSRTPGQPLPAETPVESVPPSVEPTPAGPDLGTPGGESAPVDPVDPPATGDGASDVPAPTGDTTESHPPAHGGTDTEQQSGPAGPVEPIEPAEEEAGGSEEQVVPVDPESSGNNP